MTRFRVITSPPDEGTSHRLSGATLSDPTAGGVVHVVQGSDVIAWPLSAAPVGAGGDPCRVEAGESFSDGALLATDSQGRAVQATTGDMVVARALEAGSSGTVGWVVLEPQREL